MINNNYFFLSVFNSGITKIIRLGAEILIFFPNIELIGANAPTLITPLVLIYE